MSPGGKTSQGLAELEAGHTEVGKFRFCCQCLLQTQVKAIWLSETMEAGLRGIPDLPLHGPWYLLVLPMQRLGSKQRSENPGLSLAIGTVHGPPHVLLLPPCFSLLTCNVNEALPFGVQTSLPLLLGGWQHLGTLSPFKFET